MKIKQKKDGIEGETKEIKKIICGKYNDNALFMKLLILKEKDGHEHSRSLVWVKHNSHTTHQATRN